MKELRTTNNNMTKLYINFIANEKYNHLKHPFNFPADKLHIPGYPHIIQINL